MIMANLRRTRLKAIRVGVNVKDANKATSQDQLIKLMQELPNTPKEVQDPDGSK